MQYCGKCGGEISDDARFCEHCGARIDAPEYPDNWEEYEEDTPVQAQQTEQGNAPAPKKSKAPLMILLAILLALLAGGGVFLFMRQKGSPDPGGKPTKKEKADKKKEDDMDFDELEGTLEALDQAQIRLVSADVSEFPKVRLYVRCEDSSGQTLTLSSPTARIRETIAGGKDIERTIKKVEQLKGNQGLGVELLTDKSGSMRYDLASMQRVMTEFIDSLDYKSGDKVEIISFDSFIMYMCDFTDQKDLLKNGVSNMTAYGDTALYDALVTGIENAGARTGANCVIAFTDGVDNVSMHTYEEAINLALQKEIPVYIIGTSGADQGILHTHGRTVLECQRHYGYR